MNDDASIICVGGTGGYFGGKGLGGGIARSTNGGATWAEVAWGAGTSNNMRYAATYRFMAADAAFTNVWATTYGQDGGAATYGFPKYSSDGGATWQSLSSPGPAELNGLAVSADGRIVFITTSSGPMYLSIDGGASFNPKPSAGFTTTDATSGATMATNGKTLYYLSNKWSPMYVSRGDFDGDLGTNGVPMLNSLPYASNQGAPIDIATLASGNFYWSGYSPNALATSHDGKLVIIIGTWQYFTSGGYLGGLLSVSRDGGGTFTAALPTPGFQYFSAVAMSPDGRVVLASSIDDRSPSGSITNTMTHALWLSWDYGANWMQSLHQDTTSMWNTVRVSGDGATLFAGGAHLWKGALGGATTPKRSIVRPWIGRVGSQTSTNAGNGTSGPIYDPSGMAAVGSDIYVGARAGHKVLKLVSGGAYYVSAQLPSTPGGTSTIVAGTGVSGAADGAGASATFNTITGLAASTDGSTIFISEQGNKAVRAMAVAGYAVTTLLGGPSTSGCAGGTGAAAGLGTVQGVAADPAGGTLYVSSFSCFRVFSVSIGTATATPLIGAGGPQAIATGNIATGTLTVTAVSAGAITNHMRLSSPFIVGDHNCNSVGCGGHVIGLSTASCTSTCTATLSRSVGGGGATGATLWLTSPANGVGTAAQLAGPFGLAATTAAAGGLLYVAEPYGSLSAGSLRKVVVATGVTTEVKFKLYDSNLLGHGMGNLLWSVRTLAGGSSASTTADANGVGTAANFAKPNALAIGPDGVMYVGTWASTPAIKKVDPASGYTVSDFLASAPSSIQLVVDPSNSFLYAADQSSFVIRSYAIPGATAAVWAGTGANGATNGPRASATFSNPFFMCFDEGGTTMYVTEKGTAHHGVRAISMATGTVSTLAGGSSSGTAVDATGTNARFNGPLNCAVAPSSLSHLSQSVFVADYGNNRIRMITPAGVVTTFVGGGNTDNGVGTSAKLTGPSGVAFTANPALLHVVQAPGQAMAVFVGNAGDKRYRAVRTVIGGPGVSCSNAAYGGDGKCDGRGNLDYDFLSSPYGPDSVGMLTAQNHNGMATLPDGESYVLTDVDNNRIVRVTTDFSFESRLDNKGYQRWNDVMDICFDAFRDPSYRTAILVSKLGVCVRLEAARAAALSLLLPAPPPLLSPALSFRPPHMRAQLQSQL